jgi:hypothetical protein
MNTSEGTFLPRSGGRALLAVVTVPIVVLLVHGALYWRYTIDDSFILYRYAENFAAGSGLVYNPGEYVEGYTSFLWVLVLGVLAKLGAPVLLASKVLGLTSAAIVVVFSAALGIAIGGRLRGLLTGLLLAGSGVFVINAVEGLETQFFAALVWASIVLHLRESDSSSRVPVSVLLALLATLTRPDGILLLPALLGLRVVALCKHRDGRTADAVWLKTAVALCLLTLGAYSLWRWSYYGDLLPNTYFAKPGGSASLFARGVSRVAEFVTATGGPLVWGIALLSLIRRSRRRIFLLPLIWLCTRLFLTLWSGGAWMGTHRFMAPALPALILMYVSGVETALQFVANRTGVGRRSPVLKEVGAIFAVAVLFAVYVGRSTSLHSGALDYTHRLERAHVAVGQWLRAAAPVGSTLACEDTGALPYYSRLVTVDILGLSNRYIAHLPGGFYEKSDPGYVLGRSPDLVVLLGRTSPPAPFVGREAVETAIATHPQFHRRYALAAWTTFADSYNLWVFRKRDLRLLNVPQ